MSRSARARGLLALVLALTVLAAAGLPRLRVAADLEGSLEGHAAQRDLEDFRSRFGNFETFFLYLPVERLDARALGDLHDLVTRLSAAPGVRRVTSLLDFLPRPAPTRAALEADLAAGRALERFVESLASFRLATGLALSRDGKHLGLLVSAAPGSLAAIEQAAGVHRERLLGYPVTERRVIDLVRESNRRFVPVAFLGGVLLLALFLRRGALVLLAAASVFAPLVWLLGTMGWCGERLNSLSTMLLPILLSTALTSTMYVFSAVLEVDATDQDALDHHLRAHVRVPQLLCALSAGIGFASMLLTPAPLLRRFGGWATAGVIATLAAAIAIPRAGLALTTRPHAAPVQRVGAGLARLATALAARPAAALVIWTLCAAVSAAGLSHLTLASSASSALLPDDPITRATADYARHFGAPTAVELVYQPREMAASAPAGILAAQALQRAVEADPLVESTVSIADLCLDAGSRIAGERLPHLQSEKEAQLYADFLAGDSDPTAAFLSPDGLTGRLLIRLRTDEAFAVRAFARRIVAKLDAADLPRPLFVTGLQHASAIVHTEGVESALLALAGSFLGHLTVFCALFRSLRLALLCFIPNAVPLLLVYGVMGHLRLPLDVAAALVGPVVYGMIMDDTLHLIHRLRSTLASGLSPADAVVHTVERLGRAVVVSSFTLAAGLGLSALAPFALARSFGLAAAATVLVGLACELALTPLLVARFPGVLYAPPRDQSH